MKILFLSAMPEEIAPILDIYKGLKITCINQQDVYSFSGKQHNYLFSNTGVGKVNAAITTTLLIDKYHPDLIINIGTSGGVNKNLAIADFVIADKLVFHDVDVTGFNYELGQLPSENTYFTIPNAHEFLTNWLITFKNSHIGTIATGDQFINNLTRQKQIETNFDNVYAIEMESAAIVMTAFKFNVPIFVIRTISDLAYSDSSMEFNQYLDIVSKNFVKFVEVLETTTWIDELT